MLNHTKLFLFILFTTMLSCGIVYAADLPVIYSKSNGVTITEGSSSKNMLIHSDQPQNILQWQSFDIGKENIVEFLGKNSSFLNIVRGNKPTNIHGTLSSEWEVKGIYIVNPNGINVTGRMSGRNIVLSTARLTQTDLENYERSGEFIPNNLKGMGRVSLLGEVSALNIKVIGSQIIIKDINKVSSLDGDPSFKHLQLHSSTNRIDIGSGMRAEYVDLSTKEGLKNTQGIVNHTDAYAISTEDELKTTIALKPDAKFFLTNDITLALEEPLDRQQGFTGSFDGAFNTISYTLNSQSKGEILHSGLFSHLEGAKVENLNLEGWINVSNAQAGSTVGALAGTIRNSELSNIKAYETQLQFPFAEGEIYAGGLAGIVENSKLKDSVSSLSQSSLDYFNENIRAGHFAASASGNTLDGLVGSPKTAIFNGDQEGLFSSFETLSEDEGIATGFILDSNDNLTQVGFLDPFFMVEDQIYEYNEYPYGVPAYRTKAFDDLFAENVYAKVEAKRDAQGRLLFNPDKIIDSGVYEHYLHSNTENGRGFYFVNTEGHRARTGIGTITVKPNPNPVPEPQPEPLPEPEPQPEPLPEPEPQPEPLPEPEPQPEPLPEPEPQPEPLPEPEPQPEPLPEPEPQPEPLPEPEPQPEPLPEPQPQPEPLPEPVPEEQDSPIRDYSAFDLPRVSPCDFCTGSGDFKGEVVADKTNTAEGFTAKNKTKLLAENVIDASMFAVKEFINRYNSLSARVMNQIKAELKYALNSTSKQDPEEEKQKSA